MGDKQTKAVRQLDAGQSCFTEELEKINRSFYFLILDTRRASGIKHQTLCSLISGQKL